MNWLIIVLRLIHILFGVFWAGSIFFIVSFMLPTARAAGPAGAVHAAVRAGRVRERRASGRARSSRRWPDSASWAVSNGDSAWFGSPTGIVLSIGALAALVTLAIGFFVQRPTMGRMKAIAIAIEQNGAPTPEQAAELPLLQAKMGKVARTAAWLLAITVVCMAVARYV
ncbi:MAG: hypothetical protein U0470_09135 [Anaerolineae bacterium]